jgi:hypothetical protein
MKHLPALHKLQSPSLVAALALLLYTMEYPANAAESVNCYNSSTNTDQVRICYINEPDVRVPLKEYPQIKYKPGDRVYVNASGCAYIGTKWKQYNRGGEGGDYSGDNLYSGLVYLPGVWPWQGGLTTYPKKWTWDGNDMKRVGEAAIRGYQNGLQVKNSEKYGANWLHLWLGYEDNHYSDNSYDGPSDGADECTPWGNSRNVSKAFVEVRIVTPTNQPPNVIPPDSIGKPPWASWTFPPVVAYTPPNPWNVVLPPLFIHPNPTLLSVDYQSRSFPPNMLCPISTGKFPSVTRVTNRTDNVFDDNDRPRNVVFNLGYGGFPLGPNVRFTKAGQTTNMFNGQCANGTWSAIGPTSVRDSNDNLMLHIDVSWTCASSCSE